ncbi:hypothetical protein HZC30_06240 [Candidatus Woesearchaeota archaeon]|nr:hypothetical protein [Candidatus Woesearchaeota archaeon]
MKQETKFKQTEIGRIPENWEMKKRTFHMKHNEEMNCNQCNKIISAHIKNKLKEDLESE